MRLRAILASLAILILALGGCAKTKQEAVTTTSDSLVAANPQEQAPGTPTPQTTYEQPAPQATAPAPAPRTHPRTHPAPSPAPAVRGTTVPSGTSVAVTINTRVSSETAKAGDTWTGVVKDDVMIDGRTVIPAGSTVTGTVTAATPASHEAKASLDFAMSSVNVEGHSYHVSGGTEAIVAGSVRARNLGAIAGSAAAGAIIGKAVSGSGKGALIGGLLGGAAATGAVAKSKGYQVVIKEGTNITFTTNESVSIRT